MTLKNWNRKKIVFFATIVIFVAIVAFGLRLWYGSVHAPSSVDEIPNVCQKHPGETVSWKEFVKGQQTSPLWMQLEKPEVTVELDGDTDVDPDKVLKFSEEDRSFSACGVGKGRITLKSKVNKAISLSVPFEISFASKDAQTLLGAQYETIFADNIVTSDELASVTSLKIEKAADVAGLACCNNLEKIFLTSGSDVIILSNMELLGEKVEYFVEDALYGNYVSDTKWTSLAEKVYPQLSGDGKCVFVLDLNGGTIPGNTRTDDYYFCQIDADSAVDLKKYNVEKEGYTFGGWRLSKDGTTVSGQYILHENAKAEAVWKENVYRVVYNSNGGTGDLSEQQLTYTQSSTISQVVPVRTGHTFLGWSTDPAATKANYKPGDVFSKLTSENNATVQLYAVWDSNKYTVCYYDNNQMVTKQTVSYDEVLTIAKPTSREGSTFKGWSLSASNSQIKYVAEEQVKRLTEEAAGIVNLYAVWDVNVYNIVYDANGGSSAPSALTDIEYSKLISISTQRPTRVGYTFVGWSDMKLSGLIQKPSGIYEPGATVSKLTSKNNENVTLYAVWVSNPFTVKFEPNGKSGITSKSTVFYYGQSNSLSFNDWNVEGYTLVGWSFSSSNKVPEFTGTVFDRESTEKLYNKNSSNVTLYAIWDLISYTVKYDSNGGSAAPNSQTLKYDQSYTIGVAPTKTGYTFNGWKNSATGEKYAAGDSVKNLSKVNNSTVTLVADWVPISYTVQFDLGGGEPSIAPKSAIYGHSLQLPSAAEVTKEGNVFKGWKSSTDGVVYDGGASVTNLVSENGAMVTMTAQWEPAP